MSPQGVDLIRMLVESGHISAADLIDAQTVIDLVPHRSHTEHYERAIAECPAASLSTYKTNFRRLVERFGGQGLNEVTTEQLVVMGRDIFEGSIASGGIGLGAQSSFIHSARFFYRIAMEDGAVRSNPAAGVQLPRRRRRVRRALSERELRDVYDTVIETSQDVRLDILLLDFHRETAARRGGAIALRMCDINIDRSSVLLREKGGHEREVPASRELLRRMLELAARRGALDSIDSVFRYRNGSCLTRRRYNTIFKHVQQRVPWASRLGVSIHWFRHTTLSDIAAAAGIRVAAAYAGHLEQSVTDVYTVPTFEDLVVAHQRVFGFD